MADVHRFSEQLIDLAERLSAVADAAAGKRRGARTRSSSSAVGVGRWILLPATGAALYAAAKSEFFARQAKAVLGEAKGLTEEAKVRAGDLPTELMSSVRDKSGGSATTRKRGAAQTRRRSGSARKATTARAGRKTRTTRRASPSG